MNVSNSYNYPCYTDKAKTSRAKRPRPGWSSGNWSGYALTGRRGAYHSISGEWFVPFVKPSLKPAYSSAWIGIDGFQNNSLIQTGTGHEFINGIPRYYAWWEILPDAETIIPLPVYPGDHMRASIVKKSRSKWSITLRNITRNWKFRTIKRYTGPQTSAEWIVEAPQVNNSPTRLAHLSPVLFMRCRVNGRNANFKTSMGGIMARNNVTLSYPSRPNHSRTGFIIRQPAPNIRPLIYSKKTRLA